MLHKAKFAPIYIIETVDKNTIVSLELFDDICEPAVFSLANVQFIPHVSNGPLRRIRAVGWGKKVAVIDSGIISSQINAVHEKDYTGYGNIIKNNHGTKVAKIIKYYARGVTFYNLKVAHCGDDIYEGTLFSALDDAYSLGVDIINMSIEISRNCLGDCILCDYVNAYVRKTGITVVVAAGNHGNKGFQTIGCPGAAENAITVGAINSEGNNVNGCSAKGVPGFNKPNLLAPGTGSVTISRTRERVDGTSFAVRIITGILASLFSKYQLKEEVISNLYQTCRSLGLDRHIQGFGVVDLERLVDVCENGSISSSSSG